MTVPFSSLDFSRPDEASISECFGRIEKLLDAGDRDAALKAFDEERRRIESWSALTHLKFAQDTQSAEAIAERDYADFLSPKIMAHEVRIKKRFLDDPDRAELERLTGAHTLRLWACDVATFDERISDMLVEEARLSAEYTSLAASARINIDGQTVNLSGIAPWLESADRDVRHEASAKRWAFFEENGEKFDRIYDRLVHLRHEMAQVLGYETYTPLGYQRMRRVDYTPEDVARFRDEVRQHVVPLISDILEKRRVQAGWDRLRAWDENFIDPQGNPKPAGGYDLLMKRAQEMFDRLGGGLSEFFKDMAEGGYLDLINRDGKAGGGFCTAFPEIGMPFIFANFNGTNHDINVFTHEMGHAYQNWLSRDLPGIDLLWPTMEAAEINSMGLEFLTWPEIDLMVEDGAADRFRQMHLISSLSFLPYGVCVDHFQHEVYARPDMTPDERHALWLDLEKIYLPWRDYGDMAWPAKGGRWQAQGHIYNSPFYYIDYTLALCCAMQLWLWSRRDYPAAMASYEKLCRLGGSLSFTGLVKEGGLVSPFSPGVLKDIVSEAVKFSESS